jgi:hypothetical protein
MEVEKSITELSMTNKTIQLHFKNNKGIVLSILTLGEITETRKENGSTPTETLADRCNVSQPIGFA